MPRSNTKYVCSQCGYETPRWLGKCPDCGAWGTLSETVAQAQVASAPEKKLKREKGSGDDPCPLDEVSEESPARESSGSAELDRVLGGGIVEGSLMLVAGDPGIGKSTLLLQVSAHLANAGSTVLYVSGEESSRQIKIRARRLGISAPGLLVMSETDIENVMEHMRRVNPDYMVIDSIQTMYRPDMASAPGSVSQVRESAALLMQAAKTSGCAIFLVGHVTKEGSIAGPRVLEHMVDCVLYFEGEQQHQYRILRAAKNRFGSVNEMGLFEMRDEGMIEAPDPSEILLAQRAKGQSGGVVLCALEGTRPVLVDVQALVAPTNVGYPRRMASGIDQGRLALLLAVLERRAGLKLYNQDVYINIAGGLTLDEPACDLALVAAVASSARNRPIDPGWAVMGEVGLAGEVRAVAQCERRLSECRRLGFTRCIIPKGNLKGMKLPGDMDITGVSALGEALYLLMGGGE